MRKFAIALLALFAVTAPAAAGWQDRATPFDRERLSHLDQSRDKGLASLARGPVSGDAAAIRAVVEAKGGPAANITGIWRCRTMKLGGVTSIIYTWFNCRIEDRGGVLSFRKINGSQRITGTLYPHQAGGYVLLGAWTVNNEPAQPYSGNTPGAGSQATANDAVGYLTAIGPNHLRIEFPEPVQESDFDVMELRR